MFGQGGEEMNLPGKGLPFAKMHGNGNDFVVIDNRYGDIPGGEPQALLSASAGGGPP